MSDGGPILAIDTATSRAVVALGDPDGTLRSEISWIADQRHSEELLPRIATLLAGAGIRLEDLGGIVVGTGPGAFTGLRVGLATAKTLAGQLAIPLAGIPSGTALLAAARTAIGDLDGAGAGETAAVQRGRRPVSASALLLLLPAGSSDRILVRDDGLATLLPGGREPELAASEILVAVDLQDRAPVEACRLGVSAQAGLAVALVRLGAARLAAGQPDDPLTLVPEYVTLPRGVVSARGEIAWSRDPR